MRNFIILFLILPLLIISTGCSTVRRYSSSARSEYCNSIADINLFGFTLSKPAPAEKNKSLWDMSAEAQAQFIKILEKRYPDNQQFFNSLNYKYMTDKEEIFPDDYASRDIRLVFSVSKKRDYSKKDPVSGIKISRADRLEYLKISFKIREDSVIRFTGWDQYSTDYGSVDIAEVSSTRSLDLSTTATLSAKNDIKGGELSAGAVSSVSRKEDQSVKYRYLKFNGRLNNDAIEMEEEGTRETDLTGNIIAVVSMQFAKYPVFLTGIEGITDSSGKFNEPRKLEINYTLVTVPAMKNKKDTIHALLSMDYIYRNVVRGSKTYQEWDDRVKYYTGYVNKTVPLFTASDYVPDLYCIGTDSSEAKRLRIETPDRIKRPLIFRTYDEASQFYQWLTDYVVAKGNKDTTVNIRGHMIRYGSSPVTENLFKGSNRLKVLSYYGRD